MTVAELIAKLQEMPQDAILLLDDSDGELDQIFGIEKVVTPSWALGSAAFRIY